jgi:hypothetical protein
MSINEFLLLAIASHLDEYDCPERKIEQFIRSKCAFEERQQIAVDVIGMIMESNEKQMLLEYVAELARVEPQARQLQPWARDHVVHALLCFMLGIYLNEEFLDKKSKVNPFQWKIAGLFHDVGYPLQIATDALITPYVNTINSIKRSIGSNQPDLAFGINLIGLTILNNEINALDLIQERVKRWDLDIDAKKSFEAMSTSGQINHGIVSSLAVLYVVDILYQAYNPERVYSDILTPGKSVNFNQKYFERDIVSACSAIFVHALPISHFAKNKIDRSKAPLAFLLKLADALQEWERPSLENQNAYAPACFTISNKKKLLTLKADILDRRKKDINDELSCLVVDDVRII